MNQQVLRPAGTTRPPLTAAPSAFELARRFAGRDIIIVGNGPTGRRTYSDLGLPLWCVNGGWQWHIGAELVWMMYDLEGRAWDNAVAVDPVGVEREVQMPAHLAAAGAPKVKALHHARIEGTRAQMEEITRRCPVPIMTSVPYPEKFPQTVAFPLAEVLDPGIPRGVENNLGPFLAQCDTAAMRKSYQRRMYLAETICYAAAWALHIGVKSVSFGGCDYGGVGAGGR